MNASPAGEAAPTPSAPEVRRIGGKIVGLVGIGLIALLVAAGFGVAALREGEERGEWVRHTLEVEVTVGELGQLLERSEASRRGHMLQPSPQFRETWRQSVDAAAATAARLEQMVADNPPQQARARALGERGVELGLLQQASIFGVDSGDSRTATESFAVDTSPQILRDIRARQAEMIGVERQLLVEREQARVDNLRNTYAILAICALLVLLIIGLCIVVIRRYTRELAAAGEVLTRLNTDLEGVVRERTGELVRANDEIQRFAYIVSHDLRSPLVNVMGFTSELESAAAPMAKLIGDVEARAPDVDTREARRAVDEDLPEAVRFIRGSTEKMDRLITAILTLARQGRRTLTPEPLAMTALLQEVADGLAHRTEALGARIEIEQLPDIVADRVAIEQIFANIVENAVKYLRPGRPGQIRVSGRAQAGRLIYEVADNGRGIDPRDHARVFDLFRRSGAQDQQGEGIGLAHVRSLVWRLGGSIEVQSALDEGATFRLSLPPASQAEDKA